MRIIRIWTGKDSWCQIDGTFHFWNLATLNLWCHRCIKNIWQKILLLTLDIRVLHYWFLITITRDTWLELSEVTDKWHWLKSYPHSMQVRMVDLFFALPTLYSMGDTRCISHWLDQCSSASMGYENRRHCSTWTHVIANWTLKDL